MKNLLHRRWNAASRGHKIIPAIALAAGLLAVTVAVLTAALALARPASQPAGQASPIHPTFPLLDADGANVLDSGQPISTMQTCGACHDTEFIASHSFHADAGVSSLTEAGQVDGGRPWDISTGIFGRWDPLSFRYLSPEGERIDLTTADWLMQFGERHVGGGPAVTSRSGQPLPSLAPDAANPETSAHNPQTGELEAWDWQKSGVVEMNCFLCHTPQPNAASRTQALRSGNFAWANTATLAGSGLVEQSGDGYRYLPDAFQPDGQLKSEFVFIQDPSNQNCGQCHGLVHDSDQSPLTLTLTGLDSQAPPEQARTQTTGQVISGERINESGMNLSGKQDLERSWDVHAERQVSCTDCHYSLNNPVYYQPGEEDQLDHLTFDPRRLELGEYLKQPLHQFARGQSAQSTIAPELKDSMRRCESCHNSKDTHTWLPYAERHTTAMACESCHIPHVYAPALQQQDWTVIQADGQPLSEYRGVEGPVDSLKSLVTGYQPVLLARQDVDGQAKLAPYNLVTSWYWVYGDPPRPVSQADLQQAYLQGEGYAPEVIAAFDENMNGTLETAELNLDTQAKQELIAGRLASQGLDQPRVVGEIQPYSINHTVTHGEWATRDCQTCHSRDSRVTGSFQLASYIPAGTLPQFVASASDLASGQVVQDEHGALFYQPDLSSSDQYVLGYSSVSWVDIGGALIFLGVLAAIAVHSSIRLVTSLRRKPHAPETQPVYMYSVYERLWHWLQTFTILGLLFTGLVIHKPDIFGIFSFRGVVLVHNILAAILVANAFLSLFYHLASGEIKQFIPRPRGFIDDAVRQAVFYTKGIFRGEAHPFEKTPGKKLNPLQQVTYFGLLNVLLPLQIVSGALMWGVQLWPGLAIALGGLPLLAPFHTLIAWLFASFIVAHVYLTTTGVTPLAGIEAMMNGWEEVEVHPGEVVVEEKPSGQPESWPEEKSFGTTEAA